MDIEVKLLKDGYVKSIEDKLGCSYNDVNATHENRVNAVTSIAAITRGRDKSNNPEKRFKALMKEAAPNYSIQNLLEYSKDPDKYRFLFRKVSGRSLEYIPVVTKFIRDKLEGEDVVKLMSLDGEIITLMTDVRFDNEILKFSYREDNKLYTNARTLLNAGIRYEDIPYNKEDEINDNYFIAEVKTPYFVFAQLRTHGLLSQVAVSERVVEVDEYWIPDDLEDRLLELQSKENDLDFYTYALINAINMGNDIKSYLFNNLPVKTLTELLKKLGYRKEVYNRFPNMVKYKTFIIGGWLNNPYQWGHFLLERNAFDELFKGGVQKETEITAKAIREVIEGYLRRRK